MREISFRGWHPKLKEMFDFDMWIPWEAETVAGDTYYTKNMEIMQFTALKDKNGVEIYEGDIVAHISTRKAGYQKDGDMIYKKIVFGKTNTAMSDLTDYIGFWATSLNDDEIELGGSIEYQVSGLGAIVIGNIYENGELLD